jgi:hypothetical protein
MYYGKLEVKRYHGKENSINKKLLRHVEISKYNNKK